MRRVGMLVGLSVLVVVSAGCAPVDRASPGSPATGGTATPGPGGPDRWESFTTRATEVAAAWRPVPAWRTGYVPLQEPTVLVGDPGFSAETKTAFGLGWYRDQVALPTAVPKDGTIRFPDGTLTVPLVAAAEAYRQLDQGDPPTCPGRPKAPMTPPAEAPGGPDDAVSSPADACVPLTVTGVRLGTVPLRTSRGEATVPAWLFDVAEIDAPVARVAVAPSAVVPLPEPPAPAGTAPTELVGAQGGLRTQDGTTLTWQLGVGACDTGITPLVQEHDHVVVVGGGVVRSTGVCRSLLKLEPVTATLDAPLGDRPVLDVLTGQLLLVAP
ncbi:hypothetical protein [Micromonospora endolithica]|uniref:Uncharacterized protein n=1 Tax=Micromonospora endolithica TaxID=230091 RepID=A0A3A9ZMW4_9ACTN|nr:hypothetical protein [Micromonospora endolithica]RKN49613.1 hypothetical protein D7223_09120 [Micromonospora endolithica]TWJ23839.1 hypothetical protein JD76_03983 [Micromonospora endolithica]